MLDGIENQLSDDWLPEKHGTGAGFVEQAVHDGEGFAGGQALGGKERFTGRLPCRRNVMKTGCQLHGDAVTGVLLVARLIVEPGG
jgi:hypothetical protein